MSSPNSRLRLLQGHISRPCRGEVMPCEGRLMSEGAERVLATRRRINVGKSYMSYLDTVSFSPMNNQTVLFLHGNPTAAYLWRNIIPHVQGVARCVAPDLIGQGHSGKLPGSKYYFLDHYKYLCEWIDKMAFPGKLHLVIHDWGSGLGFHWANEHRERVASISFMEALLGPFNWDMWPEHARQPFKDLRTSSVGEDMILEKNLFIELMLPGGILRNLSDEEMEEYRRPFKEPGESRRPTLTWPREIAFHGDGPHDGPKNMVDIYEAYHTWLSESTLPKLYIHAEPGFFSDWLLQKVSKWHNLRMARAPGHHFMQEDSPDQIGQAIKDFLISITS